MTDKSPAARAARARRNAGWLAEYLSGTTLKQIAQREGLTSAGVSLGVQAARKAAGCVVHPSRKLPMRDSAALAVRDAEWARLREEGLTLVQIAERYAVNFTLVSRRLRDLSSARRAQPVPPPPAAESAALAAPAACEVPRTLHPEDVGRAAVYRAPGAPPAPCRVAGPCAADPDLCRVLLPSPRHACPQPRYVPWRHVHLVTEFPCDGSSY